MLSRYAYSQSAYKLEDLYCTLLLLLIYCHILNWFNTSIFTSLMWAMQTDNTASAANIPGALGVQGTRCFNHVINLIPRHLLFPVKRQATKPSAGRGMS